MTGHSRPNLRIPDLRRAALALAAALILPAGAQRDEPGGGRLSSAVYPRSAVCPERDVRISVRNVGDAVAEDLDTDGETTVLWGACFVRDNLAVDAESLRTSGGVSDAVHLSISGRDLIGSADTLHAAGSGVSLTRFRARLLLPNPAFPGLPVSAGEYDMVSSDLTVGDNSVRGYSAQDLTLTDVRDGSVIRLIGLAQTEGHRL